MASNTMNTTPNNKISPNVKKFGEDKGYSLEKIARLSDLSLNTAVKIKSGVNKHPTIETLTKIVNALDVKVDDLLK